MNSDGDSSPFCQNRQIDARTAALLFLLRNFISSLPRPGYLDSSLLTLKTAADQIISTPVNEPCFEIILSTACEDEPSITQLNKSSLDSVAGCNRCSVCLHCGLWGSSGQWADDWFYFKQSIQRWSHLLVKQQRCSDECVGAKQGQQLWRLQV